MNYKIFKNLTSYIDLIGDFELIDTIYLYIETSISSICSILSLICIWIFFYKKDFKQPFYIYYKILSINSFLHDFFGIWFSICKQQESLKYQYVCIQYQYFFIPFHIFSTNHTILIQIGIIFDLIKIFDQRLRRCYLRLQPNKISFIFFMISVLIGAFGSFLNKQIEFIWFNYEMNKFNSTAVKIKHFLYLDRNDSIKSNFGLILYLITINLTLILMLAITNICLFLVIKKRYTNNSKIKFERDQLRKRDKLSKKTAQMALFLCSTSILSRVLTLIGILSFSFDLNFNFSASLFIALGDLFIFIDSGVLFFVCFKFNKLFKKHVLKMIPLFKSINSTTSSIIIDLNGRVL